MPRKKKTDAENPTEVVQGMTTRSRNKRKAPDSNATDDSEMSPPSKRGKRSGKSASDTYTKKNLIEFFNQYKDEEGDYIGPSGMMNLLNDLGYEPEHIAVLALAWKLNAQRMGYFTYDEFVEGLHPYQCDNITRLKELMKRLETECESPEVKRSLYLYAFNFGKDTPEAKNLDVETAVGFIEMLLKDNPHTSSFCKYLREQKPVKVLTADQWKMWWEFAHTVDVSLEGYDPDMAWPSLIDEYVDFVKSSKTSE